MNKDQANDKQAFWQPWLSTDTTFCRALVSSGYLSEEQMLRAADRYHLGRSRDGGVIFWQIDSRGTTRDGKIMSTVTTVTATSREAPPGAAPG